LFSKAYFPKISPGFFKFNKAICTLFKYREKHQYDLSNRKEISNIESFFAWCYNSYNQKVIDTMCSDKDFIQLQKRVCGLIIIFTLLHPSEINLINSSEILTVDEGLFLYTSPKSQKAKYLPIFLPKLDNKIISPYFWCLQLLYNNKYKSKSPYLFIDLKDSNNPLPPSSICAYLFQIIEEMKLIDRDYSSYSFKRATMSYFNNKGFDEKRTITACRHTICNQKDLLYTHYKVKSEYLPLLNVLLQTIPKNIPQFISSSSPSSTITPSNEQSSKNISSLSIPKKEDNNNDYNNNNSNNDDLTSFEPFLSFKPLYPYNLEFKSMCKNISLVKTEIGHHILKCSLTKQSSIKNKVPKDDVLNIQNSSADSSDQKAEDAFTN
jgi:hypothetical protein